jgi:hypothetical protein
MKANDKNTSGLSAFGALGLGMELGINVALPLVLGVWVGSWLDRLLGTGGLIMLVMCVVALMVGAYNFYRVVARELKWK